MTTLRAGGEVDAFCNRCKLTLAHTIIAMVGSKPVRVQCNTCNGQHVYRGPSAPTSSPRSTPASAKPRGMSSSKSSSSKSSETKTAVSIEAMLASKDLTKATQYSPRTTFKVDELISHPTFGYGFVSAVRADKIDVNFKFAEKTLVHGRAAPADPAGEGSSEG